MPQRDHPLRGFRVVALIDDTSRTRLVGILEWVDLDGEVAIRCDDGEIRYGWPCLELAQAPGTYWEPATWEPGWPTGPDWPDDEPVRPTETVWLPGDEPDAGSGAQGMP